jgi:hypothetical protein
MYYEPRVCCKHHMLSCLTPYQRADQEGARSLGPGDVLEAFARVCTCWCRGRVIKRQAGRCRGSNVCLKWCSAVPCAHTCKSWRTCRLAPTTRGWGEKSVVKMLEEGNLMC